MNNFNLFTPTKVVFGKDTESQTGALVKAFGGQKVLLHYGSGSVVRSAGRGHRLYRIGRRSAEPASGPGI